MIHLFDVYKYFLRQSQLDFVCRREDVLDEDPCGMLEYAEDILPFECLGADRQKSKAFFDACDAMVEEQGWSFAQLQACGMLESGY